MLLLVQHSVEVLTKSSSTSKDTSRYTASDIGLVHVLTMNAAGELIGNSRMYNITLNMNLIGIII